MNNSFCIVGLGNHAKNKIYPSLKKVKNSKIYSVTRNIKNIIKNVENFSNIYEATKFLNQKTIFIISTPPNKHFKICKYLLFNNFNVFVEKPAFTSLYQYKVIKKILDEKININFVELFFYKYSKCFTLFYKQWIKQHNKIASIDINFLIPEIPKYTFRSLSQITNSPLYDMGCYPISLLIDLGFNLNKPDIKYQFYNNKLIKKIFIKYQEKNISINIIIGIGNYMNNINLKLKNNDSYLYNYFFYAVKKEKKIIINKNNNVNILRLHDIDCFYKFFTQSNKHFRDDKINRLNNMFFTIKTLEYLSKSMNKKV